LTVFGTSGTTSFPKLAAHDQRTIVRHAYNAARAAHLGKTDRTLGHLPFCGTFGFVAVLATLAAGGRVVAMQVYTPAKAIDAIRDSGVTYLATTEAILRGLFAADDVTSDALRSWTKGIVGGVTVRDLVEQAEREFDIALVNVYGSSELNAYTATWDPWDPIDVRSICGGRLVGEGMSVRVVDPQNGAAVKAGSFGELQFSGYNVTRGYLSNDAATRAAMTADGWYRSNDWGRLLEDGNAFEYQSRLDDTLRLRGYLVSPAEIEELLATHHGIAEAQVVGVHQEQGGEDRAVAFVRLTPGAEIQSDEIRQYCKSRAASWKVPDLIVQVAEFPMTASANGDKVQKNKLRALGADLLSQVRHG
jgi:fatty-acyl-CoA synthase